MLPNSCNCPDEIMEDVNVLIVEFDSMTWPLIMKCKLCNQHYKVKQVPLTTDRYLEPIDATET